MQGASAWVAEYDKLTPAQKDRMEAWMGTNMFIARELGLEPERWFEYIRWAFDNPFDHSFVEEEAPRVRVDLPGDGMEKAGGQKKMANVIGGESTPVAPTADAAGAPRAGGGMLGFLNKSEPEKGQGDG
jgi:hypothetical protein